MISQDFGKTEQIASSLGTTNWDLVIFDEAHRLAAPLRAFLLDRLMNARLVERLLLLLAVRTSAFDTWFSRFLDLSTLRGSMSMTQWSGPLKNWDGSVVDRPRIALQIVPYTRGPDEVESRRTFRPSFRLSPERVGQPVHRSSLAPAGFVEPLCLGAEPPKSATQTRFPRRSVRNTRGGAWIDRVGS